MTDDRTETITDPAEIRATDEPDERGDFPCCATPAPVGAAMALDLDAIEAAAPADDGWWSVPVLALVAEVRRLTAEAATQREWFEAADAAAERRLDQSIAWMERAEAAEAEVVTLRAKVAAMEALADRWQKYAATLDPMSVESAASIAAIATMKGAYEGCAEKIRAALATTGEGQ